jgi:Kef-type K+ transport system membrane component KefB/voltage-gated potassium channel Kch
MEIEPDTSSYRELLVFLIAAGLVVPFAHRLRISPILTFLVVGVLIGPYGLAASIPALGGVLITNDEGVRFLAELGVVFLLFTIGLELSLRRLVSLRNLVFGLGGLQIATTAAAIGAVALLFGNPLPTAIILGLALALSSTAIVMQILTSRGRLGTRLGRTSFAILLMQDLAVIPILFIAGSFSAEAEGPLLIQLAKALGLAVLVIGGILIAGRLVLGPIFRMAGSTRSPEIFMASALLVIVATGMATATAGLSVALGAFLAGLLFSDTEYRHEIEVTLAPFRGLLLGIFFMSVGMGINVAAVAAEPLWVPLSVAGLLLLKAAILMALALAFRLPVATAVEMGLLLSQGGEFAFVVLGSALRTEVIDPEAGQFFLLVTGVSMALAPLVARGAEAIGRRLERRHGVGLGPEDAADPAARPVIIAGFGRVGQMLSAMLEARGLPYLAIEREIEIVRHKRLDGAPVYYGDASRPETLRRLGVARAAALVVTTDDGRAAEHIVTVARSEAPDLFILARGRDSDHAQGLYERGADEVIPEAIEAALQLAETLLIAVGLDAEAAARVVEERRRLEHAGLEGLGNLPSARPAGSRRARS